MAAPAESEVVGSVEGTAAEVVIMVAVEKAAAKAAPTVVAATMVVVAATMAMTMAMTLAAMEKEEARAMGRHNTLGVQHPDHRSDNNYRLTITTRTPGTHCTHSTVLVEMEVAVATVALRPAVDPERCKHSSNSQKRTLARSRSARTQARR